VTISVFAGFYSSLAEMRQRKNKKRPDPTTKELAEFFMKLCRETGRYVSKRLGTAKRFAGVNAVRRRN
jgi:hypothetical protein